jgi:DNA (cytosine-5)-methyltransferase 1
MKLLDLFCGAGGAAMGYHQAGFDDITGVDIKPQKRYPFNFVQADALEYLAEHSCEYDVIHASPPCQAYSVASIVHRNNGKEYPKLIDPVRESLEKSGAYWIIENVKGAPLVKPVMLCGLMFNIKVFRHRYFETNFFMLEMVHPPHKGKKIGEGYFSIAGGAGRWKSWGVAHKNISKGTVAEWRDAMEIQWMTRDELKQAIPPAYTKWIGTQLMEIIRNETR